MRYVVSIFSSALLTLKHIYGDEVHCIAWRPEYQKRSGATPRPRPAKSALMQSRVASFGIPPQTLLRPSAVSA